jgi:hypothetical protein
MSESPEPLSEHVDLREGLQAGSGEGGKPPPWSLAWGESLVPVIDEIECWGVATYADIAAQLNRRAVPTSTGARWYATSAQKLMQLIDAARSEIANRHVEEERKRNESRVAREERRRQRALRVRLKAGFRWKYGCSHWVVELLDEFLDDGWRQCPDFAKRLDNEVAGMAAAVRELSDIVERYDGDHKHRQAIQWARDLVQWMP